MTWDCEYCGQVNDDKEKQCSYCGAPHRKDDNIPWKPDRSCIREVLM